MKIRRLLAVWSAHCIKFACQLTGKQGATLAGKAALTIYPPILGELAKEVKEDIFVVCGTNGKTTTNNLLASVLEGNHKKVVCNRTGSNMLNGVASAFVLNAGFSGHLKADYACIEVDEASTVKVFPHFQPDYMILTNLFRDQLDRYGEIDTTMELLAKAMGMAPHMKILANADDSLSAFLALEQENPHAFYGISQQVIQEKDAREVREGQFCKRCGEKMTYHFYHYSQLGDYECPNCGFKRPAPDYNASHVSLTDGLSFQVGKDTIKANYRGFYNVYNILAVYGAASMAKIPLSQFNHILGNYTPQFGRNELFEINGTKVLLNLAKNPAGFNQNISAVMTDHTPKDIIILINDNSQDGIDVSWLWDVDFDRLQDANAASITVCGKRCRDMQLRLKYVDISSDLEPDIENAITSKLQNGTKNLYVLVNYTGLYSTHNILKKLEGKK